jgi:hypothetical protein
MSYRCAEFRVLPDGLLLSATAEAIASAPSLRRPVTTPIRSAAGRFWLTFHLPSMRAMGISIPTIAFRWAAIKSAGASSTVQGIATRVLVRRGEFADLLPEPFRIIDHVRAAPGVHVNVIPRRHNLAGPVLSHTRTA